MFMSELKSHSVEPVKRFSGFNEDCGCLGRSGIVSSVGMLPPAIVTSLQHSFPQSWNNRDPHHSPHLLLVNPSLTQPYLTLLSH